MNRSAKCIQMLVLLKNKNIVSVEELARSLDTNPRNIREYRKELEAAGYTINSYRGTNGGYQLEWADSLVLPALSEEEIDALAHAREYLKANQSITWENDAIQALEKMIASIQRGRTDEDWLFVYHNGQPVSKKISKLLYTIRKAITTRNTLEMKYQSRTSIKPKERLVDPYALILQDQHWYLYAYDHLHKDYRTFRVSEQRMMSLEPSFSYFRRDPDFLLADHIGATTLMPGKKQHYVVEVKSDQARFFEEIDWGENLHELDTATKPGWKEYVFDSDQEEEVFKQLYKMKNTIRLLKPEASVKKYLKGLKDILENYEEYADSH